MNIWKELDRIRNEELLIEMPIKKKELEKLCDKYKDVIYKHILLIGIFGNTLDALNHWATEIASFLSHINDKETDGTRSGKLKKEDYRKMLFTNLCSSQDDIMGDIIGFRDIYCKYKEEPKNKYILNSDEYKIRRTYPYFEVTNNITTRTWKFFISLASTISEMLSKKNNNTLNDIKNVILNIYKTIDNTGR